MLDMCRLDRARPGTVEPELGAAQRRMLLDFLEFFEGFVGADEPHEQVLASEGAGWVCHILGRHGEAETHYARALAGLEALEVAEPGRFRDSLAALHERRGRLFTDMDGRRDAARSALAAGLRVAASPRRGSGRRSAPRPSRTPRG